MHEKVRIKNSNDFNLHDSGSVVNVFNKYSISLESKKQNVVYILHTGLKIIRL